MALKIRLQRHGASHRPFYRMVVTEALARRDGRFVEVQGTAEGHAFDRSEFDSLLGLATKGVSEILELQASAIETTD